MTKNYFSLIALLFYSFVGFSQTNMLQNPSFESSFFVASENFDDWHINFNTIRSKVTDATDGTYAVKLQTNRSGSSGFYGQLSAATPSNDLAFENGKTYTISFDYKVATGTITELKATLQRDNFYLEDEEIKTNQTVGNWETFTYDFTANNTAAHNFDIDVIGNTSNAEIIIDNTKISEKIANPDRDALIALYNATNGPNWTNKWDMNSEMSTWYGVTLNSTGRVERLNLSANNLIGVIPSEIGNLVELEELSLEETEFVANSISNQISGNIPNEIINLTKLKILNFRGLNLSGNIPSGISNLINLNYLNLGNCGLSGTLPSNIGDMVNLKTIILYNNNLSGNIPSSIGQLKNLEEINLTSNKLEGNIPQEIGLLDSVKKINFYGNNLIGAIPTQIGQLVNLEYLDFRLNKLTGTIPTSIGNLTKLTWLNFGTNELTGSIPQSINQLVKLKSLGLQGNNISGNIPELSSLIELEFLTLYDNQLSGSIPPSIGELSSLNYLDLSYNLLSGTIPSEIGNLSKLEDFFIHKNNLEGNIPESIGLLPLLSQFYINDNNLTGNIPIFTNNFRYFPIFNNSFVFENIKTTNPNHIIFVYSPQKFLWEDTTITKIEGDAFTISVTETNDVDNKYQWYKDNTKIEGATNATFNITNLSSSDSGRYSCTITNTVLTELTLYTNAIFLEVNANPELDDDNDGVKNSIDNCSNTPTGEKVNNNGCSESQLDDDKDGISNAIDQCPNTPNGNSVNANGCALGQLDDDKDGVSNALDQCLNTPSGAIVNTVGCSYQDVLLPKVDDITAQVSSTSCSNSNNGKITIDFKVNQKFTIVVTGPNNFSKTYTSENRQSLNINDLLPGIYKLVINSETGLSLGAPNIEFNLNVETPESLKTGKASVDNKNNIAKMVVSGSKKYLVTVNNNTYTYDFEDTNYNEISFSLTNGKNAVTIQTDKICQGIIEENIIVNQTLLFPNPTSESIAIIGLQDTKDASVILTNSSGKVVIANTLSIQNGRLELSVSHLPAGLYIISITSKEQEVQSKFIKK